MGFFDEYPADASLQTSGMLTRQQILRFFDRGTQLLENASVQDHLRSVSAQVRPYAFRCT